MKEGKAIAVVCSGGGMRCAYSAGALVALAKEHDVIQPDFILAASGSAGSAFYYLARQYDSIQRIWTELLSTPRFICWLRPWRIMDIDYLIDSVFKKQEPLDIDAVRASSSKYYIPVTDAENGEPRYMTKSDGLDEFELLRATKAIPFAYGRIVSLQGRGYVDGFANMSFSNLLRKAEALEANVIIGIDCSSRYSEDADVGSDAQSVVIRPRNLSCHRLTRDKKRLSEAYMQGYEEMRDNKLLRAALA